MNKAANIYWDSSHSQRAVTKRPAQARKRKPAAKAPRFALPWWLSVLVVSSIFVMLCVSINLRAFSSAQQETDQNVKLSGQIQNLMDENLALQEEIHSLKTDPEVIRREAKRIGLGFQAEKVPVPSN